jgi:hypothetical protein
MVITCNTADSRISFFLLGNLFHVLITLIFQSLQPLGLNIGDGCQLVQYLFGGLHFGQCFKQGSSLEESCQQELVKKILTHSCYGKLICSKMV